MFSFAGFLKIIAPRGRVLARFFCPWGRGFRTFFVPGAGWGIRPFKKFPWGLPGGMVSFNRSQMNGGGGGEGGGGGRPAPLPSCMQLPYQCEIGYN